MPTLDKRLLGPVKVRVLSLRWGSAVPEGLKADRHLRGAGAVSDFGALLKQGRLSQGEASPPKRLQFRLNELAPFEIDEILRIESLNSVEAKGLGSTQPRRRREPSGPGLMNERSGR